MSEESRNLDEVKKILEERDALNGWLAKLDAAQSDAPQAVRARVRQDYERRLEGVTDRLRSHSETISNRLDEDRKEHADLSARARLSRDALAEAELRHAVGEYDSGKFESERSRHTGDLETYELSLGAIAERIERLEDVHNLVSGDAPVPTNDAPTAAVTTDAAASRHESDAESVVPIEELEVEAVVETINEPAGVDSDEAALLAVFEPDESTPTDPNSSGADEAPAVSTARSESDQPDPAKPEVSDQGPLTFIPRGQAGAPQRRNPAATAPPLGMSHRDQAPKFVRPALDSRGSELASAGAEGESVATEELEVTGVEREREPVLPSQEAAAGPTPRTLRCGECGGMNRPLEWYCEQCGAELTAGG